MIKSINKKNGPRQSGAAADGSYLGLCIVAQSVGMDYVGPFTFNSARSLVGGLVLIPCLFILDRLKLTCPPRATEEKKKLAAGGFACGVILFFASSAQQIGIMTTPAGKAGFYNCAVYRACARFGHFSWQTYVGCDMVQLGLATVGMYFAMCQRRFFRKQRRYHGDSMRAAVYAAYTCHRLFRRKWTASACPVLQFFIAGILSGICAAVFEQPKIDALWQARASVLYAGVLSSGVAYTLQIIGQRDTKPVIASLILGLESVFAALTGAVVLGESFTLRESAGCVLILAAVTIAQTRHLISFKKQLPSDEAHNENSA